MTAGPAAWGRAVPPGLPQRVAGAGRLRGVADVAPAVVAAGVLGWFSAEFTGLVWTGLVSAAMVGSLALRRIAPMLCGVAVFVLLLVHVHAGVEVLLGDVAVLVVVYSLAGSNSARARRLALVAGLAWAAVLAGAMLSAQTASGEELLAAAGAAAPVPVEIAGMVLVVWLAGQWRRTRRDYVASLVDRARRAEMQHEQEVALGAAAERARIARDVHDVVTHSLSVMVAQADAGRYVAAASPSAAVDVLQTVAATGRSALADMQRLLLVLRQDGDAVLTPQPDVATVPELVRSVRAGGLPVDLEVTGQVRLLTPAVGLTVYRVVQEALTNVLKHAGPAARATVHLAWSPTSLTVRVEDDGTGGPLKTGADRSGHVRPGTGQGLRGMHERVTAAGGSVRVGPRPGGGYLVDVELPVGEGHA